MRHASLFSGIGGPEIAAAMLGWENVFHCEINPFGRRILEYWFPNSDSYEDIKTTDFTKYRGGVDILTGGFPCQPFSFAGRRRGADDDRYLWPQMLRAIDEIRPAWVVGENVAGICSMVEPGKVFPMASQTSLFDEGDGVQRYRQQQSFTIERVCRDLEGLGYAVQPMLIPACSVGAPHRRDRVFIIAHAENALHMGLHGIEKLGHEPRQGNAWPTGYDGETRQSSADTEQLRLQHDLVGRSEADVFGTKETRGQDCISEQVQRVETNGGGGASTYADGSGSTPRSESETSDRCGTNDIQGQARRGQGHASEWDNGLSPVSRHASDTDGDRGREVDEHIQSRFADGSEPERACGERHASNASCKRRGELRNEGKTQRSCRRDVLLGICRGLSYEVGERWKNFPTVSPVHRGNDGLPFDVDNLTIPFSKWRNESLKAYGNAIVPQVMYEIFRVIEIIEKKQ